MRFLTEAKNLRRISMEELRDAFAVSYETAAHRFTNLATARLDIPVHFMKVHESGTIIKAYENDSVRFPSDALGAVEGTIVCRNWTARTVFDVEDRFSPWYQYTDTPIGTFWCTSRIEKAKEGEYSVSVGVPFDHVKWFRGRETTASCGVTLPGRVLLPPGARRRSPSAGPSSPGRPRARRRACSPRCRPAPSPASTRPRCTSSSRRTRRDDLTGTTIRERVSVGSSRRVGRMSGHRVDGAGRSRAGGWEHRPAAA